MRFADMEPQVLLEEFDWLCEHLLRGHEYSPRAVLFLMRLAEDWSIDLALHSTDARLTGEPAFHPDTGSCEEPHVSGEVNQAPWQKPAS